MLSDISEDSSESVMGVKMDKQTTEFDFGMLLMSPPVFDNISLCSVPSAISLNDFSILRETKKETVCVVWKKFYDSALRKCSCTYTELMFRNAEDLSKIPYCRFQ